MSVIVDCKTRLSFPIAIERKLNAFVYINRNNS